MESSERQMPSNVDPKEFWENKILVWEKGRYQADAKSSSLLERLADRASNSLRFRLAVTVELLRPHIKGKRVVELGCGSGLITADLLEAGAASYVGYDISERAISNATALAEQQGTLDRASFHTGSVEDIPPLEADIVFSLGLLDWLDDETLARVFEIGGQADYLHAISERRVSLSQYLHRLYVQVSYGWKTGSYIPRYYSIPEMEELARHGKGGPVHVFRDSRLSFGALVSSLPVDVKVG